MRARIITPPAAELFSLGEAKEFLRVTHDGEDATIESIIPAARLLCEEASRMSFVTQTHEMVFTLPRLQPGAFDLGGSLIDPDDINSGALLWSGPVASIVSVTARKGGEEGEVLDVDTYELDEVTGRVVWLEGFRDATAEKTSLAIRYTCGLAVDVFKTQHPDLVNAVKMTMAVLFDYRGQAEANIPPAAMAILARYWRPA